MGRFLPIIRTVSRQSSRRKVRFRCVLVVLIVQDVDLVEMDRVESRWFGPVNLNLSLWSCAYMFCYKKIVFHSANERLFW